MFMMLTPLMCAFTWQLREIFKHFHDVNSVDVCIYMAIERDL